MLAILSEIGAAYCDFVTEQVQREADFIAGMQQGVFQSLDPLGTTTMIMTFYLGVGSTVDENGETPLDLHDVARFVLRALGAQFTTSKEKEND